MLIKLCSLNQRVWRSKGWMSSRFDTSHWSKRPRAVISRQQLSYHGPLVQPTEARLCWLKLCEDGQTWWWHLCNSGNKVAYWTLGILQTLWTRQVASVEFAMFTCIEEAHCLAAKPARKMAAHKQRVATKPKPCSRRWQSYVWNCQNIAIAKWWRIIFKASSRWSVGSFHACLWPVCMASLPN